MSRQEENEIKLIAEKILLVELSRGWTMNRFFIRCPILVDLSISIVDYLERWKRNKKHKYSSADFLIVSGESLSNKEKKRNKHTFRVLLLSSSVIYYLKHAPILPSLADCEVPLSCPSLLFWFFLTFYCFLSLSISLFLPDLSLSLSVSRSLSLSVRFYLTSHRQIRNVEIEFLNCLSFVLLLWRIEEKTKKNGICSTSIYLTVSNKSCLFWNARRKSVCVSFNGGILQHRTV